MVMEFIKHFISFYYVNKEYNFINIRVFIFIKI